MRRPPARVPHGSWPTGRHTSTRSQSFNRKAIILVRTRLVLSLAILSFAFVLVLSLLPPAPQMAADGLVAGDIAWMLTATGMVLFMTPGLAFFYGGMVSPKNVISTMLQCFIAMGVVSV